MYQIPFARDLFSNCPTQIAFNVSGEDAEAIATNRGEDISTHIITLPRYQFYVRSFEDDLPIVRRVEAYDSLNRRGDEANPTKLIKQSLMRWGTKKKDVENLWRHQNPYCLPRKREQQQLAVERKSDEETKIAAGNCDILTGGFPCQPFSQAGRRKGTCDDRFLWPEMLRIIREFRPRWIVGENVAGLLTIEQGMVLKQILADLEGEGYEVECFVIPAVAVNAPHRRDRVWIVAHRASNKITESGEASNAKPRDTMDSLIETGATKGQTGTKTGLKLQPNFVEWMMGYPQGWTDLNFPSPNTVKNGSKD
jgi:site-specific DNA-cytosine methylase